MSRPEAPSQGSVRLQTTDSRAAQRLRFRTLPRSSATSRQSASPSAPGAAVRSPTPATGRGSTCPTEAGPRKAGRPARAPGSPGAGPGRRAAPRGSKCNVLRRQRAADGLLRGRAPLPATARARPGVPTARPGGEGSSAARGAPARRRRLETRAARPAAMGEPGRQRPPPRAVRRRDHQGCGASSPGSAGGPRRARRSAIR